MPTVQQGLTARLRPSRGTQTLEEFDRGWASLLAKIDDLRRQETTLNDEIVGQYLGSGPKVDTAELKERLTAVRAEIEPLLEARANEGALRQRVVTELAERRFDEIAAERRKLEHRARTALTELRQKAEEFAKADAHLRSLGDKDAEIANEQIGCNDRGHLNRHIEPTFRGIGLGNVDFIVQRIEEDLIAIARRAE